MADPTATVEIKPDPLMLDLVKRLEAITTAFESAAIRVLILSPGDVVVLEHPGKLSEKSYACLLHQAKQVWPDNKVVILEECMHLAGVTGAGPAETRTLNPENSQC